MEKSDELPACPFCASAAQGPNLSSMGDSLEYYWWIGCTECDCDICEYFSYSPRKNSEQRELEAKERVRQRWCTRKGKP